MSGTLPERLLRQVSGHTRRLQVVDDRQRAVIYLFVVLLIFGMTKLGDAVLAVLPGQSIDQGVRWDFYGLFGLGGLLLILWSKRLLPGTWLFWSVAAYHLAVCLALNSITDLRLARSSDGGTSYSYLWVCIITLLFSMLIRTHLLVQALLALVATASFWFWQLGRQWTGLPGYDLGTLELMSVNSLTVVGAACFISWVISRLENVAERANSQLADLGSYRLEQCLGRGGMGEVWLARHRLLATPAAIKMITQLDDPTAIARFQREAKATAALKSSNTVRIYDYGVSETGTFYYAMERLDGINLDALVLEDGPQPPARVIHILRQACYSLMEAHDNGLVHRDIKPANLFLCRDGVILDHVKILDFGLVIATENADQTDANISVARLTQANTIFGTPEYMSPEQAQALDADGRADVYALACVCFWLLTGRPPFKGDTPMATLLAHCQQEEPRVSEHSEQAIPEPLDLLLLACMQKEPANRPRDCRQVLQLLDRSELATWRQEDAAACHPYQHKNSPSAACDSNELA
jgi:tRNA A-37 threonylcarbamoyl transferase component Bud32